MTAEFVIALPAVLVVLGLAIGAIFLATERVVLTSAAAEVARLEARGDASAARERLAALPDVVTVRRSERGSLHCVQLSARPGAGLLSAVRVGARGCAVSIEGAGSSREVVSSTAAAAREMPGP